MGRQFTPATLEDIREKVVLSDVVSKVVILSNPRAGRQKGLCPFHDERTPSFTVNDGSGLWYCFGCGEHGDAITFVMKHDHASFAFAVKSLAERFNIPVEMTDGTVEDEVTYSQRARLIAANKAAAEFFTDRLTDADAEPARNLLVERGFDLQSCVMTFGVGFSPRGWDDLVKHLTSKGFTKVEIVEAGLATQSDKGVFDRFRGRLMWPILNERGEHVGFGGRQLFHEENAAKYLNTTETSIYKKASTLYGLNLALKAIAKKGEVIVVEGYTDVMAMHASGVHNVIASSGTAFGPEHLRVLRRFMAPQGVWSGRVIFAFDGDTAGRKAAVRAFENTVREMQGQVFAVPNPDGMDPCDLRLARGDEAVRDQFAYPVPMVQFVLDQILNHADVSSIQGRFDVTAEVRSILSMVSDRLLKNEYAKYAAGRIGVSMSDVLNSTTTPASAYEITRKGHQMAPAEAIEFEALKVMVQCPEVIDWMESVEVENFTSPMHRGAAAIILSSPEGGMDALLARCTNDTGRAYITRLAVEPLEMSENGNRGVYGVSVMARLLLHDADRRIATLKAKVGTDVDGTISRELVGLTDYRKGLLAFF